MISNQLLTLSIILLSFSAIMSCSSNKDNAEMTPFNIQVVKTEKNVQLKCTAGCEWEELSFINNSQPYFVDKKGVRSNEGPEKMTNSFLFSITPVEKGIDLIGQQGTAWTSLSFILKNNVSQTISEIGME